MNNGTKVVPLVNRGRVASCVIYCALGGCVCFGRVLDGGANRSRTGLDGFADHCLTAWLSRLIDTSLRWHRIGEERFLSSEF